MADAQARGWGPGWPDCQGSKMVTIHAGGIKLSVRREVAPIFKGFCDELVQRGYPLGAVADDWGFACRQIRGSDKASNHSWGLAVDLNSTENPMGSKLVTDFPAWAVEMGEKKYGLHWGGRYKSRPDAMHWEWLGTPDEAKWLVGALAALPASEQPEEPDMYDVDYDRKRDDLDSYALQSLILPAVAALAAAVQRIEEKVSGESHPDLAAVTAAVKTALKEGTG
jgi:hypothetical protein